nr:disease resistance protein PIK5-NP-like [Setaria viridis]
MVYEKLVWRFDCRAFVCVSLNPLMDKIFKNLLFQLDGFRYKNINEEPWDEARLIGELRSFLQHKRYFIVIDDIWNSSLWEMIRHALIENDHGSRIISTTRSFEVAKKAENYEISTEALISKWIGEDFICKEVRIGRPCVKLVRIMLKS